jgi:hypothetical protein
MARFRTGRPGSRKRARAARAASPVAAPPGALRLVKKLAPYIVLLAVTIGAASPLPLWAGWWLLARTPGPPAPVITVVTPNSGTTAGGTSVVITGTTLSGATAVSFSACGAAASYVVNGPSQITAVSPACSAQTIDIRVTTPVGISAVVAADQYQFNTPSVPSWVPFVGGQVASFYKTFQTQQYYYSGAVQTNPAQTITRAGSKTCPDFTVAPANTACIGSYGLYTDQGFTNSLLQSSTFQNSPWTYSNINDTTFSTTTTAPDGTNTAEKLTETNATSAYFTIAQNTGLSAATTYTVCGYVKGDEVTGLSVEMSPTNDTGNDNYMLGYYYFGSGPGTAGSYTGGNWSNISASITPSVNGFYRWQFTGTFGGFSGNPLILGLYLNNGGIQFNGTTGYGLYLWGLQVTEGSTCPPLIQTTTVAVTTNPDVVTLTSLASTLLASPNAAIQVVTQGVGAPN